MTPDLSVIIPTFRRQDSLQRLLQALSVQEDVDLEVIVVDQNPPGYLDEVLSGYPVVKRLMLTAPNASNARNQGFLQSGAGYILFVDDDLVPLPDFCSNALSVFRDYPAIRCYSPLVYNEQGKQLALDQIVGKRLASLNEDTRIYSITDTISAALLFDREYFALTGGFDPLLFEFAKTAEDQEFFLRMLMKKLPVYFVPFVEIYHDENVPGGCELRTADYWVSREKCMKSWAYRHRIHHKPLGTLSAEDWFQLARSGFLNKEVLTSGMKEITRQIKILSRSIKASAGYFNTYRDYYVPAEDMNHLIAKKN